MYTYNTLCLHVHVYNTLCYINVHIQYIMFTCMYMYIIHYATLMCTYMYNTLCLHVHYTLSY